VRAGYARDKILSALKRQTAGISVNWLSVWGDKAEQCLPSAMHPVLICEKRGVENWVKKVFEAVCNAMREPAPADKHERQVAENLQCI
jgi:hypothetical protein